MITWIVVAVWVAIVITFVYRWFHGKWRKVPTPVFENYSSIRLLSNQEELQAAAREALKAEYEIKDIYGEAYERRTKRYLSYLTDRSLEA